MNHIGQRIRELRRVQHLTQEGLAERLGITAKSISKWECGITAPDLALIGPLSRILHTTADDLLGLTGNAGDPLREKFDRAYRAYRDSRQNGEENTGYWWAREAVREYPEDYGYLLWLADSEYRLAFAEVRSPKPSGERLEELTDNALRRYETILDDCPDPEIIRQAALGKILILRFCERIEEADWSAEFEYPDPCIRTAEQLLPLFPAGQELLKMIKEE